MPFRPVPSTTASSIFGEPFDRMANLYCASLADAAFASGKLSRCRYDSINSLRVSGGQARLRLLQANARADSVTLQKSSYCLMRLRSQVYSSCLARQSLLSSAPWPGNLRLHVAITECTSNNVP